jgi:hypothetical protein
VIATSPLLGSSCARQLLALVSRTSRARSKKSSEYASCLRLPCCSEASQIPEIAGSLYVVVSILKAVVECSNVYGRSDGVMGQVQFPCGEGSWLFLENLCGSSVSEMDSSRQSR